MLTFIAKTLTSLDFNMSGDCFILDRNQDAFFNTPTAHSKPKTRNLNNHNNNAQSPIIPDVYEIINTGNEHIVLYHESAPVSILTTAQDTLPIRRLTTINAMIPDDIIMSPPRRYMNMSSWLHSPNDEQ